MSNFKKIFILEGSVYCWGDNAKGQLCQNAETTWRHFPCKVDFLSRYHIISSCAGDGFSIFLSNYGVTLSCGDNSQGCLGHSNIDSIINPKAIGKYKIVSSTLIKIIFYVKI